MKRREFIQLTGAALVAIPFTSGLASTLKGTTKQGIQLYTLREVFEKDIKGTLSMVSKTGFKEVEAYGYSDGKIFGMNYKEFHKLTTDLGLQIVSGHYGTGQTSPSVKGTLVNDWERSVADAKAAGQKYMTIAWLDEAERKSIDDYKKAIELLNKSGELCKKYGMRLAYHNHAFEFQKIENQVPYDLMLADLDPSLVAMEMDLYWVNYAGHDPLKYFEKYPKRFELWHVKDMDKGNKERNADVGSGAINFKTLFDKRNQAGLKHFFLEQETFTNPLETSIKNGYNYLKTIL